jgi:dTDP-4-dehydrorhamnose reductase
MLGGDLALLDWEAKRDSGADRPRTDFSGEWQADHVAEQQVFLVVGGDSLVGKGVVGALSARGHRVISTTRRRNTLDEDRVFLDFEEGAAFDVPGGIGYAFIVAAATSYERCENDPLARVVNVERIPQLAADLLKRGIFVTFVSTNTVFGGDRSWPGEDAHHDTRIAYAVQKAEGELAITEAARRLGALEGMAIVRLTKVLHPTVSPLPTWLDAWRAGRLIEPFADLTFAPMSLAHLGAALATIGERRVAGGLHLSGAENVTYVDFAHALAAGLGVPATLIEPTTATAKGVNIPFKPRFSGLGMTRTTQLTGLTPQPLDAVVRDLVASLGNWREEIRA